MIMTIKILIKLIYYLISVFYHCVIFFTNIGNYYHGGVPAEWITLQVVAVLLAFCAIKLFSKSSIKEKGIIVLSIVVPFINIAGALIVFLME